MDLSQYQQMARQFSNQDIDQSHKMPMACMGLAGEIGELMAFTNLAEHGGKLIDEIKKAWYHKKVLNKASVFFELGDVLWYLCEIASNLGVDMSDVADSNIKKLSLRHPGGKFLPHQDQLRNNGEQR